MADITCHGEVTWSRKSFTIAGLRFRPRKAFLPKNIVWLIPIFQLGSDDSRFLVFFIFLRSKERKISRARSLVQYERSYRAVAFSLFSSGMIVARAAQLRSSVIWGCRLRWTFCAQCDAAALFPPVWNSQQYSLVLLSIAKCSLNTDRKPACNFVITCIRRCGFSVAHLWSFTTVVLLTITVRLNYISMAIFVSKEWKKLENYFNQWY